ncbi:MAG: SPOR domain-containing protein [Candidatus Omnitrophica bacterium]|nr:SPOR domain-containing protein [Candidatus Omnitrophota bacterium]
MRKVSLSVLVSVFITAQPLFAASSASFSVVEKYFLEGKYNSVISESEELINSGSGRKDELYYLKGLSELKANKFSDARASFNYIISHYSWSKKVFDARLGVGDSYFLEGNNTKALNVYNEIADNYPSDKNIAIVYSRLSSCYAKMGLRDKADSYHAMVRTKAPLSFEAKSAPAVSSPLQNITACPTAQEPMLGRRARKAPSPYSGPGIHSVQVGSFKNKRNADKLVKRLSARGYESYVTIPVFSSDKFYRVKVGKFASKDEASRMASKLESDGYRTSLCTDDTCD